MDPGSNKTFSKIHDLTEEMVSTTMMVTGVRMLGTAFAVLSIFSCCPHVQTWHTHDLHNYSVYFLCLKLLVHS